MTEIKNIPADFDLNHQWKLFVERYGITEDKMPEDQRREMKRAFFGSCGQMLILLIDELGDYGDKHGTKPPPMSYKTCYIRYPSSGKRKWTSSLATRTDFKNQ